jgi:tRNA-dihydrouridine synthase B
MFSIGNLHLSLPAILAPMAGISDLPYRTIARRFGCPLAFTEMINVRALSLRNRKTMKLLETSAVDTPLGVQLLGREPDHFREALDILSGYSLSVIDVNAACPVRKVVRKGEGAALLKEPERLYKIVKAIVEKSSLPVTVKIRSGWDHRSANAVEIAKGVADSGALSVCIHGRTRSQGYTGRADIAITGEVKEALSIPVVASGDIFSATKAVDVMKQTGCDAVMVARGGLGNPWIFRDLTRLFQENSVNRIAQLCTFPERRMVESSSAMIEETCADNHTAKDLYEIVTIMKDHLSMSVEFHGEKLGVINFRKFFAWYTKGLKNTRLLRPQALKANTINEMASFIDKIQELQSTPSPSPLVIRDYIK